MKQLKNKYLTALTIFSLTLLPQTLITAEEGSAAGDAAVGLGYAAGYA